MVFLKFFFSEKLASFKCWLVKVTKVWDLVVNFQTFFLHVWEDEDFTEKKITFLVASLIICLTSLI